jgi:hypothetical protein
MAVAAPDGLLPAGRAVSGQPQDQMPERPQRAVSRELCGRSEMVRESRKKGTVVSWWRLARWRQIIAAQARYLEYERDRLCQDHQNDTAGRQCSAAARECPAHKAIGNHLEAARRAADPSGRPAADASASGRPAAGASDPQAMTAPRVDLRSGGSVNGAFADLHAARVVLVDLYAEEDIQAAAPAVLARLRTCLPPTDECRQRAEALFGSQASGAPADAHRHGWLTREDRIQPTKPKPLILRGHPGCSTSELACRRAALRDAMQVSYDAADQQYAHVRSFRNVLITGTIVLSLLVLAVCLLGARYPKAIPLCFNPSSTSTVPGVSALQKVCPTSEAANPNAPPAGDVAVVALMGVLGAALSATLAVQKLRGTSAPYSVPVSLALFKLPAGALTAIAGLLLIKGGFVPGFSQLDTQGQILAYAIVFGVAQQLVTRLVDQRADDVLSKLPSKEPPLSTEKQTGQATQPAGGENPAPTVTT